MTSIERDSVEFLDLVEKIFSEAKDLPEDEYIPFIRRSCQGNPDLLAEVLSLFKAETLPPNAFREELTEDLTDIPSHPPTLDVGSRIGPYMLIERLSEGGMGAIFKAVSMEAEVAVPLAFKALLPTDYPGIERIFRQERRTLAKLRHPHISTLFDAGSHHGQPYFVMNLIDGEHLDHFCNENHWSIEARIRLCLTICKAVQFAHDRQIVHRDLKPQNILVSEEGVPTLLDFGIAKLLDHETGENFTEMKILTPRYAAPEQFREEAITAATDVYALGMILYELLTGHYPYQMSKFSPLHYEAAHQAQQPRRPSDVIGLRESYKFSEETGPEKVVENLGTKIFRLRWQLRGDLDHLLLKALAKNPDDRYDSVKEFAGDLSAHLDRRQLIVRQDQRFHRAERFVRRHLMTLTMIIVMIAMLFGSYQKMMNDRLDMAYDDLERTNEVHQFLVGSFFQTDRVMNGGAETGLISALDLLEATEARLQDPYVRQPDDQRKLASTLGQAYIGLGDLSRAEYWLNLAVQRGIPRVGFPTSERALDLYNLSLLTKLQGKDNASEQYFLQADSMLSDSEILDRPLVTLLSDRGWLLGRQGLLEESEKYNRSALFAALEVYGEDSPQAMVLYHNLAVQQGRLGKLKEAHRNYLLALDLCETTEACSGEVTKADLLLGLSQLLQSSSEREDWEQSVVLARQATAEIVGDSAQRFNLARAQVTEAVALRLLERYREAEALFQRMLVEIRRDDGKESIGYGVTLMNLAVTQQGLGKLSEAESSIRQALVIFRGSYDSEHWRVAEAKSVLGGILFDHGLYEEAAPLLREGYQVLSVKRPGTRPTREAREDLDRFLSKGEEKP